MHFKNNIKIVLCNLPFLKFPYYTIPLGSTPMTQIFSQMTSPPLLRHLNSRNPQTFDHEHFRPSIIDPYSKLLSSSDSSEIVNQCMDRNVLSILNQIPNSQTYPLLENYIF